MPYEEKRILSHSAGSISGEDAIAVVHALNNDPEFAAALKAANMELHPVTTFRPLAVQHKADFRGIRFIPPHDHLGEVCGPLLPSGNERARVFADLQRLANKVLEHHPVTEARVLGKMPANGVGSGPRELQPPCPLRDSMGTKAVVSAVPCATDLLLGLEMEVEGATGELDTNYEGKMGHMAAINEYDFVPGTWKPRTSVPTTGICPARSSPSSGWTSGSFAPSWSAWTRRAWRTASCC